MCEQGPIANTDQSQTNFLLILHTFLPMRVTFVLLSTAAGVGTTTSSYWSTSGPPYS
jgi:hypothetical protein